MISSLFLYVSFSLFLCALCQKNWKPLSNAVCSLPSPYIRSEAALCKTKLDSANICDPFDILPESETNQIQEVLKKFGFSNCNCVLKGESCSDSDVRYTVGLAFVQKAIGYVSLQSGGRPICKRMNALNWDLDRFGNEILPPLVLGTVYANYTRKSWFTMACETDILLLYIEEWCFSNATKIETKSGRFHIFVSISDRIAYSLNQKSIRALDTILFNQNHYLYRKVKIASIILEIYHKGLPKLSKNKGWANFNLQTEFCRVPVWAILIFLFCFALIAGSVTLDHRIARGAKPLKIVNPEGDHVSLKLANQRSPARKTQDQTASSASTSLIFGFSRTSSRAGASHPTSGL